MQGARTVYIAGAGVAGLTLALVLAKFGVHVVVLERNDAIQEVGAGLQISPNARHVLDRLGLGRLVEAHSLEPAGIDVFPLGARRPLVTLELGPLMLARYGAAYAVMHRADLAQVLYKACRRFANIEIVFGVRSFTAEPGPRGALVTVEEADGRTRAIEPFAFIGADGVNSTTRARCFGGPAAEYTGAVAWRATLPLTCFAGSIAVDRTTLLFGPGCHAVCYPLPHRGHVNIALFQPLPHAAALGAGPPAAPDLGAAGRRSPHFHAIAAAAAGAWTYWPLFRVVAATWNKGPIGLIGDAAHAMMPFQAQGAAMAIEDAAVLAPLLASAPDAATALARYATLRRPRIERVRRLSDFNGFAFHLRPPLSLGRDIVLALGGPRSHLRRLDWLYGWQAAEPAEGGAASV